MNISILVLVVIFFLANWLYFCIASQWKFEIVIGFPLAFLPLTAFVIIGAYAYNFFFQNRADLMHPRFQVKDEKLFLMLHELQGLTGSSKTETRIEIQLHDVTFLKGRLQDDLYFCSQRLKWPEPVLLVAIKNQSLLKIIEDNLEINARYVFAASFSRTKAKMKTKPYIMCCMNKAQEKLWEDWLRSCHGLSTQGA